MFDTQEANYAYYKWRTYSYAQGSSERAWRIEPFQMSIGGPVWIPPPLPHYNKEAELAKRQKEESDKDSQKNNEDLEYFKVSGNKKFKKKDDEEIKRLPYQLKRELVGLVDNLTVKQSDICNAMIFVMENTEY